MAFNKPMFMALCVFVRCPTNGRTLDAVRGDDKVLCNCDAAARTGGTHLISQCEPSTVEQWMVDHGIGE